MNSLTPFIHHALPDRPRNRIGHKEYVAGFCTIQTQPPGDPSAPGTQLPPPEVPGNPPHPEPGSAPQAGVPMTDGTPAACRQKNAQEFLAGKVPGVMAQYAPELFSTRQHTHSAHPAPDEDADAVQQLVEWRENAPYG